MSLPYLSHQNTGIYAKVKVEKFQESELMVDSRKAPSSRQNRTYIHIDSQGLEAHIRTAQIQTREYPSWEKRKLTQIPPPLIKTLFAKYRCGKKENQFCTVK